MRNVDCGMRIENSKIRNPQFEIRNSIGQYFLPRSSLPLGHNSSIPEMSTPYSIRGLRQSRGFTQGKLWGGGLFFQDPQGEKGRSSSREKRNGGSLHHRGQRERNPEGKGKGPPPAQDALVAAARVPGDLPLLRAKIPFRPADHGPHRTAHPGGQNNPRERRPFLQGMQQQKKVPPPHRVGGVSAKCQQEKFGVGASPASFHTGARQRAPTSSELIEPAEAFP